ncbi:MAG: hypothetical protein O7H41_12185 [Planctomycetota bacterium]|nr:hypothetical protein [Planctomycetota bacterium]
MKKNALIMAALLVALSSLAYSAWLHSSLDGRVEAAVAASLNDRELELVRWLGSDLLSFYKEMELKDYPEDPQSLEELLTPLFELTERM